MAEALFRKHLGEGHNVYSTGIEPEPVKPNAIKTLAEIGIDISNSKSKTIDDLPNIAFDYVITVCNSANERCPVISGQHTRIHHWFADPSKTIGTAEEIEKAFAESRNEIEAYAKEFAAELA
jgi:arsenate reductase